MNLKDKNNVYFIGIGGIGMSALARFLKSGGYHVSGYDKTKTDLTDALQIDGIDIHYQDSIANVPDRYLNPYTTLVVYTPAIPKDHAELVFFKNNHFDILKRSELLGAITKDTYCLAVAGTHGKTTTTSILAHLLYECGVKMTAFLGGISENYQSNLVLNGSEVTVVEADEFDRSFLTLSPNVACVTSMDADHLDVYGNSEALKRSFQAFADKLKEGGRFIVKVGLPLRGQTYGVEEPADYSAIRVAIINGRYQFDLKTPDGTIENLVFSLPGRHNLSNAVAALAMAIEYGCEPDGLIQALKTYKGVKRRFSYHVKTDDLVLIDDYAHHPEEIKALHDAVREMYPNKKILAIFQPHLYSRTRDFGDDFARSLSQFDEVLLLDIYPAREMPIEGITSTWLLNKMDNPNKRVIDKSDIVESIRNSKASIVLTIGAGDIGDEVKKVKQKLSVAS